MSLLVVHLTGSLRKANGEWELHEEWKQKKGTIPIAKGLSCFVDQPLR